MTLWVSAPALSKNGHPAYHVVNIHVFCAFSIEDGIASHSMWECPLSKKVWVIIFSGNFHSATSLLRFGFVFVLHKYPKITKIP